MAARKNDPGPEKKLSPVLARLIEEVRREQEEAAEAGPPPAEGYNRAYNRHLGGGYDRVYNRHNR